MEKKVAVLLFAALIIAVYTGAQAAGVDPFNQGLLDPVQFWVVEDSDTLDNQVTLTVSNFNLPSDFKLQFNYSGVADWTDFGQQQAFDTGDDRYELVYLRLYNDSTQATDTGGSLTFQGYDTPDDSYSLGWYNTLIINWDGASNLELTIASAGDDDNIAPVPIPTTLLLLGTGLLALVVLRRKELTAHS